MKRSLLESIVDDLKERMVFLSGPRQTGKTTLARQALERLSPKHPVYLNWDSPRDRKIIRTLSWDRTPKVAALDEIHKYSRWQSLIKGFHDTEGSRQRLLITGSARLDIYRRGGDSMLGRYFPYRLHPFSVGEITRDGKPAEFGLLRHPDRWPEADSAGQDVVESLLENGGFPEPFLHGTARFTGRWRLARRERVLSQDLRDISLVRDISLIEQLLDLLTYRVGSPLSINSLRQDMESDHKTISHWIELLERLYVVFRIPVYAGRLARSLRKERKLYFWDWTDVPDPAARYENMVASHLLKYCHWMRDVEGMNVELAYLRDREKREVDFVILKNRAPWVMIEAKQTDSRPSANLRYFQERLDAVFAVQVIRNGRASKDVFPAARFLAALP